MQASYNNNPFLGPQTQANAARYEEFKPQTGETRPDIWKPAAGWIGDPDWVNKPQGIRSGKAIAIPATHRRRGCFVSGGWSGADAGPVAGSTAAGRV